MITMSATIAPPELHAWIDRLSPAQFDRLTQVVRSDDTLPPLVASTLQTAQRPTFMSLIGSITDAPSDWSEDVDKYTQERLQHKLAEELADWNRNK